QVFKHLERLAAVANLSEANRVAYDKAVDRFYVSRIYEEDMQDRVENAMREGREKGMQEGREEGIKEGIKEGKLETAKKMKSLGVSTDIIVEATGLSLEEIAEL
ncbi:Rpn family recombination-promoting nuclease/putative transposase, partial [Phocaeicola intestinalis]